MDPKMVERQEYALEEKGVMALMGARCKSFLFSFPSCPVSPGDHSSTNLKEAAD